MLLEKSCVQEGPGKNSGIAETDAQIFQGLMNFFVTTRQNFRTSVQV